MADSGQIEKERYNTKGAMKAINEYLKVMPDDDEAYFVRAGIEEESLAKADLNKAIKLCKANKKEVPREYYLLLSSIKK